MRKLEFEILEMVAAINKDIEHYLAGTGEVKLVKYPLHNNGYIQNAPKKRGLYFVWENDQIVYIGEGGVINERMQDIKNKTHHLYKKIGNDLFDPSKDYQVSFYPLSLGRLEMEESFVGKLNTKHNTKKNRKYK